MTGHTDTAASRLAVRELIDNWAMWRDAGDWDRFATLWHPDGRMTATWTQAPARDFIARSRAAWEQGMQVAHVLGGSTVEVAGARAIAETRMQIIQRAVVHDVEVEVTCTGRFLDALLHDGGGWRLVLRQLAYEMDRMAPVDPAATVQLDPALLASFPAGYRHLAYLQTQQGLEVNRSLAGGRGPEVEAIRSRARQWLDGGTIEQLMAANG